MDLAVIMTGLAGLVNSDPRTTGDSPQSVRVRRFGQGREILTGCRDDPRRARSSPRVVASKQSTLVSKQSTSPQSRPAGQQLRNARLTSGLHEVRTAFRPWHADCPL